MEEHCYIVLYDLCKPTRDYASLYRALKQYSFWGKITESAWAIVTTQTYVEIRDNLKHFMDADDIITSDYIQGLYNAAIETNCKIVVNDNISIFYDDNLNNMKNLSKKSQKNGPGSLTLSRFW